MKLRVYSLRGVMFEGEAKALNLKTKIGEITILDHHRPLITVLVPGAVKVSPVEGEDKFFEAEGGFLEVKPGNEVSVLVD
jgi:F-type H+-transporting ATPase subunit epsilon